MQNITPKIPNKFYVFDNLFTAKNTWLKKFQKHWADIVKLIYHFSFPFYSRNSVSLLYQPEFWNENQEIWTQLFITIYPTIHL